MPTMLAAVLNDFNQLSLEEVPRPQAQNVGDVVVHIKSCGFCATDYKAIRGIRRNVKFPFIPGHEPSGIVAQVGPGVVHFKEGDEVICQPSGYCGFCKHCRVGDTHYCEQAFTTGGDGPEDVWPGAFAEYMLTRETCLFAKPANISFDAACLTEPLAVSLTSVLNAQIPLGGSVAVLGPGLRNALLAIAIVTIPQYARVMRASVLQTEAGCDLLSGRSGGRHWDAFDLSM